MKQQFQLHQDPGRISLLISRYFDATATEAEEAELRRALANTTLSSPEIDSARAVMGFYAASRRRQCRRSGSLHLRAAAAAIAVAAVCGVALLAHFDSIDNRCIAYIGGKPTTDTDRVLAMMQTDLSTIADASQSLHDDIDSQLSSIAAALSLK